MKYLVKKLAIVGLALATTTGFASPKHMVTHNNTSVESNAFIAGSIPSPHPTKAHTTNSLLWVIVRMACLGHTTNNKCPAVIKVATDTPNLVELGTVEMDVETGDITPKVLSAHGYTMTVDGPGEATLSETGLQ